MISLKQILIVMPLVQIFSPSTEEEEPKKQRLFPLCPRCGRGICKMGCEEESKPKHEPIHINCSLM